MEEELAGLSLLDDEDEAFQEEAAVVDRKYQFCLVGRCLTDNLGDKRYLFQFFHEVYVQRVISRTPWFFNNHLLILQRVQNGEDPSVLALNFSEFWVQVHELPPGRRNVVASRWLRDADRSQISAEYLKGANQSNSINTENVISCNLGEDFRNQVCNPNSIPLGSNQQNIIHGYNNWRDWSKGGSNIGGLVNGPMDLVLEEEHDPIAMLEGKKRQRRVEEPKALLGAANEEGSFDLTASSGAQRIWRLTGFYRNPYGRVRSESWELLRRLSHDQITSWVLLGDFNEIISSFEKKGGRLRSERKMNEFRMTLEDCNLSDLDVQMNLNWEADKEELFWEQRARVNWLKNGDRNTNYFHKVAVNRLFRGRIFVLEDENGRQLSSTDDFLRLASDYFINLFTASSMGSDEHLFGLVEKKVTESMNANLIKQFTEDEIVYAVKMMAPLNAPGIDGFPTIFFQRLISDNVLIAYEVLHSLKMKKRGQKGNFALKLDMSKAYDRVEWDFLAGMMTHLGFHEDWIVLIMRCVCSVTYSVSLNGCNSEWFSPSRGLRQGDPISPFLFLICAKGFSTLIAEAKQKGLMKGAPIGRGRYYINHLFFSDDSILFGDASCERARVDWDVINEYELIFGQRVNFDKFLIYSGANVDSNVKENIVNMLGVRVASNPEKYLGLPMMVGRKKSWAFANFVDRFRKQIEGWSLRYLSIGGKEVFIKSVLQAIPLYAMQCFLMPKSLCRKLEGVMNKFWWTNNKTSKGIHWSGWEPLCKPKDTGGMGFKDLVLFNKALLAKQHLQCSGIDSERTIVADTATRISSIPIAKGRSEDLMVWKYEGSGDYTIKSGYRVLFSEHIQNIIDTSPDGVDYTEFYKSLWALHIPAKIKIYRLFNNFLPHRCNLARRMLSVETVCPLCKKDPEDADHLIWSCELLQCVWTSLNIMAPSFEASINGKIRFANTFSAAEEQQRQIMALSLWGLWYRRNKLFHEGVKFSLQEFLGFIKGYSQELNLNKEIFCPSFRSLVNEIWKPPDDGFIKLNFDTAFQNDVKIAITAVLARNSKRDIVGAETYLFKNVADAFVAEARACERALILAGAMGFRRLVVEGDLLIVIKSIKKRQEDKSVLRPITQHINF
ncbi:reverse transcriptase [Gossypium australe]|uniref:Reverse transcriptase n=1 Tax=Gossypium australe TaxID=47621 RepID=A0A5B6WFT5_9ROSI|nr:reverse transcriptase [Gossypium australe]